MGDGDMTDDGLIHCENCHNYCFQTDMVWNDSEWWCIDCMKSGGFVKCECCGEWGYKEDMTEVDYKLVCEDCVEEWKL
jgi:formylmethanofuran dehydrogenase subunit E